MVLRRYKTGACVDSVKPPLVSLVYENPPRCVKQMFNVTSRVSMMLNDAAGGGGRG